MTKRANLATALHDAGAKPAQLPSIPAPAAAPAIVEKAAPAAPTLEAVPSSRPPSREGLRAVTGYINPDAHKQLRLLALEQSGSVQELIVEALNDLFRKHGKPQIA